jgi:hypothetical protein
VIASPTDVVENREQLEQHRRYRALPRGIAVAFDPAPVVDVLRLQAFEVVEPFRRLGLSRNQRIACRCGGIAGCRSTSRRGGTGS